jgi:hypothetical protein
MLKLIAKQTKNKKSLTLLFVVWFLYSAGILGFMAFNDKTSSHCLVLENNG